MQRFFFIIFAVLANFFFSQFAHAEDYVLQRSYFNDQTNTLTFAQVEERPFVSFQDALTAGYQPGTFWLKLKIAASQTPLVLKVRPIFTEEIELFDSANAQSRPLTGHKHAWNNSDLDSVSYNYLLAPNTAERDIYLRIKSVRSYLLKVDVMTVTKYQKQDRFELLLYAAYSTFTFLLAAWLFVTWLMHREIVLGLFTLQQCIAFTHTLLHGGLARFLFDTHIDPEISNYFFSTLVVFYPLVGILVNKCLLQEYGLKKLYLYGFYFLTLLSVGVIGLHFSSNQSLTFNLNSVLVFVFTLFLFIAAVFGVNVTQSSKRADALSIRILRMFYALNIFLWALAILPLQGLLFKGELALHSLLIYNMLSGLMFFFILQFRAKELLKIEVARAVASQAEADFEREKREEQSMLLSMLSHEIKTPLTVLKIVMDEKVAGSDLEGYANRAVSNIDAIVNRCLQLHKVDDKALIVLKSTVVLNFLLSQLIKAFGADNRVVLTCQQSIVVSTDADILRVIFSNLFENALKYSPLESMIAINVSQQLKDEVAGVHILFANDVGLMGEPDPTQLFKKYYRNISATKVSGSGLGLYLVQELVSALNGSVRYSPQHKRIVFEIWIPV